ncbi:hypothetical protein Pelo_1904 [Pelomyxa schiedti]|nr:hypothetical protein Pelo_1904 [Pelomyxa schiedti]
MDSLLSSMETLVPIDVGRMIVRLAGFSYWSDVFVKYNELRKKQTQWGKTYSAPASRAAAQWRTASAGMVGEAAPSLDYILSSLTSNPGDTEHRRQLFSHARRPYTVMLQECALVESGNSPCFNFDLPSPLGKRATEIFVISDFSGELDVRCADGSSGSLILPDVKPHPVSVTRIKCYKFSYGPKRTNAPPDHITLQFTKCISSYVPHSSFVAVVAADVEAVEQIKKVFTRRKLLKFLPHVKKSIEAAPLEMVMECKLQCLSDLPLFIYNKILEEYEKALPNLSSLVRNKVSFSQTQSSPALPFSNQFLSSTKTERIFQSPPTEIQLFTVNDSYAVTLRADGTCRIGHTTTKAFKYTLISQDINEGTWRSLPPLTNSTLEIDMRFIALLTAEGGIRFSKIADGADVTINNKQVVNTLRALITAIPATPPKTDNRFTYSLAFQPSSVPVTLPEVPRAELTNPTWPVSSKKPPTTTTTIVASVNVADMLKTLLEPTTWIAPFFMV